jgi:hypothetical protein
MPLALKDHEGTIIAVSVISALLACTKSHAVNNANLPAASDRG